MKLETVPVLALLIAGALTAAPLTQSEPIFSRPEPGAPVVATFPAGRETPILAYVATPPGWHAVELPGPHEVFVQNKDLGKNFAVRPGAEYRLRPDFNAPLLAKAEAGDACEITGLVGKWTQVSLDKTLIGYFHSSTPASPTALEPASPPAPLAEAPPLATTAAVSTPARTGQPVAIGKATTSDAGLPRYFEGRIVSTRHPLRPRRPFDYQLEDTSGRRLAYLDLSAFPATDNIVNHLARNVLIYGSPRAANSEDLVVVVQSVQDR